MDDIGRGRYRLGEVVARRTGGGLFHAADARLGRSVLVQYDAHTTFPGRSAAQVSRVEHPGVARILDGGEEISPDGVHVAYLVYPTSDWLPGTSVSSRQWWAAASSAVCAVTDTIVAPRNTDVLVEHGASSLRAIWHVQWLPSPQALADLERHTRVGTVPAPLREEVA